jgi:SAM-dependent methyltransferase
MSKSIAGKKLIHVGCGLTVGRSWENFDSSPSLRVRRFFVLGRLTRSLTPEFPAEVRYGNIAATLLCAPETADAVFASHVLEHLSRTDARRALSHIYAMLKPAGVFRLIVPDLESRVRQYLSNLDRGDMDSADWFLENTQLGRTSRGRGLRARARETFGAEAHLWMYDARSMERVLGLAGFVGIRRCQFGDSATAEFAEVERRDRFVSDLGDELAIECRKPAA